MWDPSVIRTMWHVQAGAHLSSSGFVSGRRPTSRLPLAAGRPPAKTRTTLCQKRKEKANEEASASNSPETGGGGSDESPAGLRRPARGGRRDAIAIYRPGRRVDVHACAMRCGAVAVAVLFLSLAWCVGNGNWETDARPRSPLRLPSLRRAARGRTTVGGRERNRAAHLRTVQLARLEHLQNTS